MRKIWKDRRTIKKNAKNSVLDYFIAWLIPQLVGILVGIGMIVLFLIPIIGWLGILVLANFYVMFLTKYNMALVRNPEQVVDGGIVSAMKYACQDGLNNRLKYSLYMGLWSLPFIFLYFIAFYAFYFSALLVNDGQIHWLFVLITTILLLIVIGLFLYLWLNLVPLNFIIQDTCSQGNGLEPLPFFACVKKSFDLMSGRKLEFLVFALTFIGWRILAMTVSFAEFFATPYFSAAMTIWVDQVMAEERDIVDFYA